jgi:hypothetical protein
VEIHKPKPWHGLREFLKEYAIVVVGVLTALAAEQVVENLHWRERVTETRRQLTEEMGANATSGLAWLSLAPCFDRQIGEVEQGLWQARATGAYPGHATGFAPPLFVFTSDAWLNARSLQVSDHLSPDDIQTFSRAYFFPSELAGDITRLHEEAAELRPLAHPLPHVTPAEADDFLTRVGRAKEMQTRMALGMMLMIKMADRMGAPISLDTAASGAAGYRPLYGGCIADPAQVLQTLRGAKLNDMATLAETYRRLGLAAPNLPE